jgi:tripartite-type tricarboxylate transporter receptor subunit TctC
MCRRIRFPGLVALGKQKTQNLSFGSPGSSTPHRLAGEMLQKYGGFTMTHIPYKGTSVAVNDLLGGQILLLFGAPSACVFDPTNQALRVSTQSSQRAHLQ